MAHLRAGCENRRRPEANGGDPSFCRRCQAFLVVARDSRGGRDSPEMPPELHGHCDPAFVAVRDAFAAGFDEHGELGGAVAVWSGGRLVVDLWAGLADAEAGAAWQEDTIAHAHSVSKPLASASVWLLVQRGLIEL